MAGLSYRTGGTPKWSLQRRDEPFSDGGAPAGRESRGRSLLDDLPFGQLPRPSRFGRRRQEGDQVTNTPGATATGSPPTSCTTIWPVPSGPSAANANADPSGAHGVVLWAYCVKNGA